MTKEEQDLYFYRLKDCAKAMLKAIDSVNTEEGVDLNCYSYFYSAQKDLRETMEELERKENANES